MDHARAERETNTAHSPVMVLLVLIATLGILLYAGFLLNPANRGDLLPYLMVVVAESVLVVQALFSMWTILSGNRDPRDFAFHRAQSMLFGLPPTAPGTAADTRRGAPPRNPVLLPLRLEGRRITVEVFITVCGENPDTVRRTVAVAVGPLGQHRTWVLDDGRSDVIKRLAAEEGARYIRRLSGNGAKAGNVNHALTIAKGEFVAIFDADFVPDPDFLFETVPFFTNPLVAFVQTPQKYGNLNTTIAIGAAYMQPIFYHSIQPGRNRFARRRVRAGRGVHARLHPASAARDEHVGDHRRRIVPGRHRLRRDGHPAVRPSRRHCEAGAETLRREEPPAAAGRLGGPGTRRLPGVPGRARRHGDAEGARLRSISLIDVEQGAFAQAGAVLARIDRAGSMCVEADFTLTARDYARIPDNAAVQIELPDQRTVLGRVATIDVQTVNGSAQSTTRSCRSTGAESATTPRGSARTRTRSSASSSFR